MTAQVCILKGGWRVWLRVLCALVLLGVAIDAQDDEGMILVVKGDSPAKLAEKHLGSAAKAGLLLGFNKIAPGTPLEPGQVILNPDAYLKSSAAAKLEAETLIKDAREELAPAQAPKEFGNAEKYFTEAQQYAAKNEFDMSATFFSKSAYQAKTARLIAITRLRVPQNAKVTMVHNQVEHRNSASVPWVPSRIGVEFEGGGWIRTGKASKAAVLLSDGSEVEIEPNTTMEYVSFVHNKGTGQVNGRLYVRQGEITGAVTPSAHRKSTIELKGSTSSIAVRGTTVRLGVKPGRRDAISLLQGRVTAGHYDQPDLKDVQEQGFDYLADVPAKQKANLAANKGMTVTGKRLGKMTGLPPPPVLQGIFPGRVYTRSFADLTFAGGGIKRVEIARDVDFRDLVSTEETPAKAFLSEALKPGTYFLRSMSVLKNGIVGPPTPTIPFVIRPDFRFDLVWDGPWTQQGDTYVISDKTTLAPQILNGQNGIEQFRSRLGSSPFRNPTKALSKFSTRTTALEFTALDAFGQPQQPIKIKVRVDKTPPTLTGGAVDVPGSRGTDQMLRLLPKDDTGIASVSYRLNDGPLTAYTQPIRLSGLNFNNVDVRVVDLLGNEKDFRFKFDGRRTPQRGFVEGSPYPYPGTSASPYQPSRR